VKTATLQSVILRAWQRAGNDASDIANVPAGTLSMMVAAAQERIVRCWEFCDWPELTVTEERTVQGDADTGVYLELEQSGETVMGEVFNVWQDDPATHVAPRSVSYGEVAGRIILPSDCPETVYVRFRLVPSPRSVSFTDDRDDWSADHLDDLVPGFLAQAVGLYLSADLLAEDGQLDKAGYYEAQAEMELVRQQDKIFFQQNQTRYYSAVTSN
jgi:hypothetical protein